MTNAFLRVSMVLTSLSLAGCSVRECYVGVKGAAASVTVKGMFPGGTCAALIEHPEKYVGDLADDIAGEMYEMSERPREPQICEYVIDGKTFIVRDQGALKVVGSTMCSGLSKRADKR